MPGYPCSAGSPVAKALVIAALATYSTPALCVLSESLTIGNAKALSLGNAVTADPPGIDAIHFNPAGLARIKGRKAQLKVVGGQFSVQMEIGDYIEPRQNQLDAMRATGLFDAAYFYDEAYNATSETAGASLMLPIFGMTDLPVILAPLGGASYSPPGQDYTVATNVYSPMMVGFYREDNDPGRFIGQRMSIMQLTYFSPSIGINITDELAVGAALTFNYVGVGMDLPIRAPHAGFLFLGDLQSGCDIAQHDDFIGFQDVATQLCSSEDVLGPYEQIALLEFEVENPLVPGFNFGVLWSPTPWLTLGASYIASFPMNMEGWFVWTNTQSWTNFIHPFTVPDENGVILSQQLNAILGLIGKSFPQGENKTEGEATVEMNTPEQYAFGLSLQLLPKLKMNLDYKFAGWSAWQELRVKVSEPVDLFRLGAIIQPENVQDTEVAFPFGLEDTWNWAVGFEYQYSDHLALRLGAEDRPSSLPPDGLTPLLPLGSSVLYGAGMSMLLQGGAQLELAMGYMQSTLDIPGGTADLGNSLDPRKLIYSPYAGSNIKTNLEAYLFEFSITQPF